MFTGRFTPYTELSVHVCIVIVVITTYMHALIIQRTRSFLIISIEVIEKLKWNA